MKRAFLLFGFLNLATGLVAETYGNFQYYLEYSSSGYEAVIYAYTGTISDLEFPSEINGYPVTKIVAPFEDCSGLRSVVIPSSVREIGERVFEACSSLSSVTFSEGLVTIGKNAFSDCVNLQKVELPSTVKTLHEDAFEHCDRLSSVKLNEGLETIGKEAFSDCKSLTSLTIPSTVTSIGLGAFAESSITLTVDPGNSAYEVVDDVLFNKGQTVLYGVLKDKTTYEIPVTVTTIETYAFSSTPSLQSIHIPASVSSIGLGAFGFCSRLSFTVDAGSATYCAVDGSLLSKDKTELVRHAGNQSQISWPEEITKIGAWAFAYNTNITSVAIPEGVTSIGDDAFECCTSLTSITFPGTLKSIGEYAFVDCSRLGAIVIPDSVEKIAEGCFEACSSMTSVTLSKSLDTIDDVVFYGCTALTEIVIPKKVTTIYPYAFWGCSRLARVTFSGTVTTIGERAFRECGLSSVTFLGAPPTSVGEKAFWREDEAVLSGYYSSVYETEWQSFLGGAEAQWEKLNMQMVTITPSFDVVILVSGEGSVSGSGTYDSGETVTLEATPREGYLFSGWSGDITSAENPLSFTVTDDVSLTATFKRKTSVTLSAIGGGTVSGGGQYTPGQTVTVSATTPDGLVFCGWNTTPAVMTETYTFTMPEESLDLVAYFAPEQAVNQAIAHHLAANELISKDEIKEMALKEPVITVANRSVIVDISLETTDTLNGDWQSVAFEGDASLEIVSKTQQEDAIRITLPMDNQKKAAFYKFVVPTKQSN